MKLFRCMSIWVLFLFFSGISFCENRSLSTPVIPDGPDLVPYFSFVSGKNPNNNITNVQTWSPSSKVRPAGSDGFIRVIDSEFVNDAGPIRFYGVNLTSRANFPETREKARFLARSLARYGINCVRLHFMDASEIWGGWKVKKHLDIDPQQFKYLDGLVYELQQEGIYVNINLHVARQLTELDGFENPKGRPRMDKGVDNFYPGMIEAQKKYAKDLLTHVNPYTGKAYINDPGVSMIEINNENSMTASWCWGAFDFLADPYRSELVRQWNQWLARKYKSNADLKKAWNCRSYPVSKELIEDGSFPCKVVDMSKKDGWQLQLHKSDQVISKIIPNENGSNILSLNIVKKGNVHWAPQLLHPGLSLKKGMPYTLKFKIRGTKGFSILYSIMQDQSPWTSYDRGTVKLDDQWREIVITFIAPENKQNIRLAFSELKTGMNIELSDVGFKSGGFIGLSPHESLDEKTVELPNGKNANKTEKNIRRDVFEFLIETENIYWQTMYNYIKNDLKARQPISGTQLQYGSWYAQARLDYCDIHNYWNHPVFPNKSWDKKDWYVNATACSNNIASRSGLTRLASVRVLGKPLTVSEYNHPFCNPYSSEGLPLALSFAAFQNWNGFFQYTWKHDTDYDPQKISGFFDLAGNQTQLVHLPFCYAAFLRGDVKPANRFVYAQQIADKEESDLFAEDKPEYHRSLDRLKLDPVLPWIVKSGITLKDLSGLQGKHEMKSIASWSDLPQSLGSPDRNQIKSETGEFRFNFEKKEAGYIILNTKRSKMFTGFVRGRSFDLGDGFNLVPGKTRLDWTTVSLVEATPGRWLVAATGVMLNTGMSLEYRPGSTVKSTCSDQWGEAPVLCEGVEASLFMPYAAEKIEAFALDPNGNRSTKLEVISKGSGCVISFGPKYKTLWYEIIVR